MSNDSPYDPPNLGGAGRWSDEREAKIPEYKDSIVEFLREGIFPSEIAELLNFNPRTIRNWRNVDKEFDERCGDAEEYYIDKHDKELRMRALHGTDEVILDPRTKQIVMDARYRDPTTGISTTPLVLKRKNDATLQFFLRHNRPEVYGERKTIDSNMTFDVDAAAAEFDNMVEELLARKEQK